MNWPSTKTEVEKPPKTRTERHTRLYNSTLQMIGQLKERQEAARVLMGPTPLPIFIPLGYGDVQHIIDQLVALGQELKPDTKDAVA